MKITNLIHRGEVSSIVMWVALVLTVSLLTLVLIPAMIEAQSPNILVTQNLTIGSSGPDVVVLQGLLSELGYLEIPIGIPMGYFGSLTRDALAKYQADIGVSPSVGYYGPVTKIAMRSQFASRGWLSLLGW